MLALPLSLFYIFSSLFIWAIKIKRAFPLVLLFPIAIDSYTLIYPGLMWKDLALLVWLPCAFILIRKIGTVSIYWCLLLLSQLIINLSHIASGDFQGGIIQGLITPIHMYFPGLVLIMLIESNPLSLQGIWKHFDRAAFSLAVLMLCTAALSLNMVGNVKQIPGVAASAGFVAVVHALWLIFGDNQRSRLGRLFISTSAFIFVAASATRGALMIFLILTAVSLFIKQTATNHARTTHSNLSYIFVSLLAISLALVVILVVVPSDYYLSVFKLYQGLFGQSEDYLLGSEAGIVSGDVVRITLWRHALDVWVNNFWVGIGSAQFDSSSIFTDRDERLSPHHAILSIAVDGGIIAVMASLSPQIYLITKTNKSYSNYGRVIFHLSWMHIMLSFIFGYAFNYYLVIAVYSYWRKSKL